MRSPMGWSRALRDMRGRFVAPLDESRTPSVGAEYWIDRLSLAEPLMDVEQVALNRWLETPDGRRWAEEG
jgi:hypothetical protein